MQKRPRARGHPRSGALRETELSMAQASAGTHEPLETLSARTLDLHRATVSLQEELEAIDWYQQRADATRDPELKRVLEHNRDEEKEHAVMLLEWIRRNDVAFARMLKEHLGRPGPIVSAAEQAEAAGAELARHSDELARPRHRAARPARPTPLP